MRKPGLIVILAYLVAAIHMLEFCTRLALVQARGPMGHGAYLQRVLTLFVSFPGFGVPGLGQNAAAAVCKGAVLWGATLLPAAYSGHRWGKILAVPALLLYGWSYLVVLAGLVIAGAG